LQTFNFDGIPDIALSDSAEVSILYGKKGGGFTAPVSYGAGDWPWRMMAVDVNNDGAPDLVFASGTDAVVMLPEFEGGAFWFTALPFPGGLFDGLLLRPIAVGSTGALGGAFEGGCATGRLGIFIF
jgi:hypothetical protein